MSLAVAHFNLGHVHEERGDLAAAEHAYRSALRLDPSMEEPRINLAVMAARLAERATGPDEATLMQSALDCYRSALLIGPENSTADAAALCRAYLRCNGTAYVDLLLRLGRGDEAIAYLRRLEGDDDEGGWAAERLHRLLFLAGHIDEAIAVNDAAYERARARLEARVAAMPDDAAARLELELFLGRHCDIDRAYGVFQAYPDLWMRDWAFGLEPNLDNGQIAFIAGADAASLTASLAAARPLLSRPAIGGTAKRLVTALLVRDEIDLLADTIACHLNQGVDLVLVTDNGSVDGSRDLLADLERTAPVQVLDEPKHNHDQALWMNRMVHLARDQHGAEWVVCADSDEIWLAEDKDLFAAIDRDSRRYGPETRILYYGQTLMIPERAAADAPHYRPTDARLALVEPLRRLPTTNPVQIEFYDALHKSIVRTDGFHGLWHGNHYAYFSAPARFGFADSIQILHFHLRTRAHLRAKQARVRAAMQVNEIYRLVVANAADEDCDALFDRLSYPAPFLERMRDAGRLVEIDSVPALRDRPLPHRSQGDIEPETARREAMAYLALVELHLPRAASKPT